MLLSLLQCCCGRWRHRQYHSKQKSLHKLLFDSDTIHNQRYIYTTKNPLSLYAMNENNRFYNSNRSYATTKSNETDHISFFADERVNDLIEYNIQNYYVEQSSLYNEDYIKHNQDIQILPGPRITIINMAAERTTDDPNWEEANLFEIQYSKSSNLPLNPRNNQLSSFEKSIKYENHPNIQDTNKYLSNLNKRMINHRLESNFYRTSSLNSITSEISGHDSESIYQTIGVFPLSNQSPIFLRNKDEYKTADIDEIEIRIKDLIYL